MNQEFNLLGNSRQPCTNMTFYYLYDGLFCHKKSKDSKHIKKGSAMIFVALSFDHSRISNDLTNNYHKVGTHFKVKISLLRKYRSNDQLSARICRQVEKNNKTHI